ncbi:MAG TPA: hypothetical protein DCM28_20185 [Phycisphaerales bacterium]|nr:hypothetical protein [Phycisphaerales bacterium]|tara:strand:- start:761 stop:1630 length:870 start_codon:yes stop_codon:yes gene_type:complete
MHQRFCNIGDPIIVCSFPRSGTHLTIDLIRKQFHETRPWKYLLERNDHLYVPIEGLVSKHDPCDEEAVARRMRVRTGRPILKTHFFPGFKSLVDPFTHWIDWINERGRFVYVFRDVRSALSSLYMARQGLVPGTDDLNPSDFLRYEHCGMNIPQWWNENIKQWLSHPNLLPVYFDEIISNPKSVIARLAEFLDLTPLYKEPLLPRPLRTAWQSRWSRVTKIRPESTAIVPGYWRPMATPAWQELFDEKDNDFIKTMAAEALNALKSEIAPQFADRLDNGRKASKGDILN